VARRRRLKPRHCIAVHDVTRERCRQPLSPIRWVARLRLCEEHGRSTFLRLSSELLTPESRERLSRM
jgi:hypothetical protein